MKSQTLNELRRRVWTRWAPWSCRAPCRGPWAWRCRRRSRSTTPPSQRLQRTSPRRGNLSLSQTPTRRLSRSVCATCGHIGCVAHLQRHLCALKCRLLQVLDSRAPDANDSLTYLVSTASRYPCAPDSPTAGLGLEGFWEPLQHGSNLPTVVPAPRWDIDRCCLRL